MSQQDGFTGGFLTGTIVGGIVGGIIGAVVASRLDNNDEDNQSSLLLSSDKRQKLSSEESIENARHRLEDKISQLNNAIDDVRQQLGPVEKHSLEKESSS
jgi:Na+/glutamate symporter